MITRFLCSWISALALTLALCVGNVYGTVLPPGSGYNLTQINGSFAKGYTDWNDEACAGYINNVTEIGYVQTLLSDGYTFSPGGCFGGTVNGIYNWPPTYHNLTFTTVSGPIAFTSVSFMTTRNYDGATQLGVDYWNGSAWVNAVTTTSGALGIGTGSIQTITITLPSTVTASQFRFFWNGGNQVNMHEFWINSTCLPTSSTATLDACDSFTWPTTGITYTATGIYADTLVNAAGCDSIDILDLTIYNSTDSTFAVDTCESYTWSVTGMTYTTSGIYADTLPNIFGCDSLVTLDLTLRAPSTSTLTADACENYTLNGITYDSSGTYVQTLTNVAGCDSTLTLTLTVSSVDTAVSFSAGTLSAMPGFTYQWVNCDSGFVAVAGATGQTFTPTASGNYAVVVTSGACEDTSGCHNVVVVGLAQDVWATLSIFPNPAQSQVTITGLTGSNTIIVVNALGQVVSQHTSAGATQLLDVSQLPAGVYTLRVLNDAGATTRKLVVE
jgi:hypothetical protein